MDLAAPLRIDDLHAARHPITVTLGPPDRARLAAGRDFLTKVLGDDRAVYGSTTGFGALVGYAGRPDLRDQADNTLAHLGAGHGPDLDPALVRATLLIRELAEDREVFSPVHAGILLQQQLSLVRELQPDRKTADGRDDFGLAQVALTHERLLFDP